MSRQVQLESIAQVDIRDGTLLIIERDESESPPPVRQVSSSQPASARNFDDLQTDYNDDYKGGDVYDGRTSGDDWAVPGVAASPF